MASSIIRYPCTLRTLGAIVAATGTPVQLNVTTLPFIKAIFVGVKGPRTNNTGTVYLGIGGSNDSQFIPIAAGTLLSLEAPQPQYFDFSHLWLDAATAGDGVLVFYS